MIHDTPARNKSEKIKRSAVGEPRALTDMKKHPWSLCLRCDKLFENCNVTTSKVVSKERGKNGRYYIRCCDKGRGTK